VRVSSPALSVTTTVGAAVVAAATLAVAGRPHAKDPVADSHSAASEATQARVNQECSACHVVPSPADAPRRMWHRRVEEMAQRSLLGTGLKSGARTNLWQLDLAPFIHYFEARSPETLPSPPPWPAGDGGLRLVRHAMRPPGAAPVPMIANVRLFDLDGDGRLEVVACDMGHGIVLLGQPALDPGTLREIARIPNPAHAEMVDLDRDGRQDLLVADLGAFLPEDHVKGAVVWLRQTAPLVFEKHVLIEGLPRTADVRAADFDGDGDLDLVVAAFGWQTLGNVSVYEDKTTDWSAPRFEGKALDARTGAVNVIPVDLDHDGREDFVSLMSQQHEEVEAFLNTGGEMTFRSELLFQAPTPAWGSTHAELADLDGDGDLDVLVSNGDSLDDFTVRPYHGVRWIENRGGAVPFERHDLAAMPGAYAARAADLDGDGDLDVAACSFLPAARYPGDPDDVPVPDLTQLTAVGWIERKGDGTYAPHPLETGTLMHTTLDVGDFDGDGDLDMVVGNFVGFTFARSNTGFKSDVWVELWENQAHRPRQKAGAGKSP
jgi:hypothetical protein